MLIKTVKMFAFLSIFILLTACFPLTSNSFKKINVGDSEKRVVKVLGNPTSKKAYYNKEHFVYYVHQDFFSLFFNIKRFPFIGFYPFLRTGEEYWVIMEDDKVVSFGSSSNYKNSIPRALDSRGLTVDLEAN